MSDEKTGPSEYCNSAHPNTAARLRSIVVAVFLIYFIGARTPGEVPQATGITKCPSSIVSCFDLSNIGFKGHASRL